MISTRSVGLLIDTVVCLTLAKWETVSGRFGGYFTVGRRISTALDVNSWHFCGIARSVDFPPLAEERGAADIAGDAPELAVEGRRSSYSPLLLSPAIGQRAGELCEGEIGRRGAVEQCRHDPG